MAPGSRLSPTEAVGTHRRKHLRCLAIIAADFELLHRLCIAVRREERVPKLHFP